MNVLVLAAMSPFTSGDADTVNRLVRSLRVVGAQAETMRIPLPRAPHERAVDAMLLARSLRIVNVDRLLALGFPACLAQHAAKTVWLDTPDGNADPAALRTALTGARAVFASTRTLAEALARAHGRPVADLALPDAGEEARWPPIVAKLLA